MKFSLWIVYDVLKDYFPVATIKQEVSIDIENVRLYTEEIEQQKNTLYIGAAREILKKNSDNIICLNKGNYIELQTTNLNEVFNEILTRIGKFDSWYQLVMENVANGVMLKQVINMFNEVLPFPILILDSSQIMIAASGNYGIGALDDMWDSLLTTGSVGIEKVQAFNDMHLKNISQREPYEMEQEFFPYSSYCQNIYVKDEFMGFLVLIIKEFKFTKGIKDFFEILFDTIRQWFSLYADRNEILKRNSIFEEIIGKNYSNIDWFSNSMNTMGWKNTDKKSMVVLECISDRLNMNLHITKTINRNNLTMYAMVIDNMITVLINNTMISKEKFMQYIYPIIVNSGYYGGISDEFTDYREIPHFCIQAKIVLDFAPIQIGVIRPSEKYIIPYVMKVIYEDSKMKLCHPSLKVLTNFDEKHNTNYYNLLYEYLKNECQQTKTAQKLNMHRSSLIHKIVKIIELTGLNLDEYEVRFHLLLSYEYKRINSLW